MRLVSCSAPYLSFAQSTCSPSSSVPLTHRMPVVSRFEKLLLRLEKNENLPGVEPLIGPPSKYGYGFALS